MTCNSAGITLHLIANAHLDPVWLWRWTEGIEALLATFRAAADLLSEHEDLVFTASSALLYTLVERYDPALFDCIRRHVAQGRWEIAGGWWVEADCNVPSGESLVRQALLGQRYFLERFGRMASVGYAVDTFGHPVTLPQLLAKAGLNAYVFFRPGRHEKALPEEMFWWQAPDGSRILAHRPPGHYGQGVFEPENTVERLHDHASQTVPGLHDVLSFFGVGNHGGGPTRAQLTAIRHVQSTPGALRVLFSRLDTFFVRVREQRQDYPVVCDELLHHARGCYTSNVQVKRWNREAEALLGTAEAFAVLAGHTQARKPLAEAWQRVLTNQFHDVITGTALPEAFEDARDAYGAARTHASEILHHALLTLAQRTDTRGEGQALVVFNSLPWPEMLPFELELPFDFWDSQGSYGVVRADGTTILSQRVQGSTLTGSRSERLLVVDPLPALAGQVYFLSQSANGDSTGTLTAGATFVENERWRIDVDPAHGHWCRLLDRTNATDVLAGHGAVPLVLADSADTWGHDTVAWREIAGCFGDATVCIEECGPVRAALRVESRYNRSTLVQRIRLYRDWPWIEVVVEIDWHEPFSFLKLAFPVAVAQPTVTASVPAGWVTRPADGSEQPCGPWVDLSGETAHGRYGMTLVSDSRHAYDALDNELRLSVLRSPIFAWHAPWKPQVNRNYHYMDHGPSTVRYWLLPHSGPWQATSAVRAGLAINRPPCVVTQHGHAGSEECNRDNVTVSPEHVVLSALKWSEDGTGVVLRLWETAGFPAQAQVALPALGEPCWEGTLDPGEIKTLHLRRSNGTWRWSECDLIEREYTMSGG